MLCELRVSQLGVIEDLTLVLGPGLTALTGETGAGKTLVVEAIELLLGGRAEGLLVRPGAAEAVVEGRFVVPASFGAADDDRPFDAAGSRREGEGPQEPDGTSADAEVVLRRVVPAAGRSRAYVDGTMSAVAALAQLGERLVDLHGQHAHQSLFSTAAQRDALDHYAGADRRPRDSARARLREVEEAMAKAGGDAGTRSREIELLRYQLAELSSAGLTTPAEDDELAAEEERLARAAAHRGAAEAAYERLSGEDQLQDALGRVLALLSGHPPLADLDERLRGVSSEVADIARELLDSAEALEQDPERLAEVVGRRAMLRELRRKYAGAGGALEDVLAFQMRAGERLEDLEDLEAVGSQLEQDRAKCIGELHRAADELGEARRRAAPSLGVAVEAELRRLAMPRARFVVRVGGDDLAEGAEAEDLRTLAGEGVTFLLAANPGEPLLPLSSVASGGELARAMLALRLVLLTVPARPGPAGVDLGGPLTLVFDEVDAGVGGEAALAVGRALADLGRRYQVLVVTHLAQVAAFADAQIAVSKVERAGRAITLAETMTGDRRVVELSRMLSGQPGSRTARLHAAELLETARGGR